MSERTYHQPNYLFNPIILRQSSCLGGILATCKIWCHTRAHTRACSQIHTHTHIHCNCHGCKAGSVSWHAHLDVLCEEVGSPHSSHTVKVTELYCNISYYINTACSFTLPGESSLSSHLWKPLVWLVIYTILDIVIYATPGTLHSPPPGENPSLGAKLRKNSIRWCYPFGYDLFLVYRDSRHSGRSTPKLKMAI